MPNPQGAPPTVSAIIAICRGSEVLILKRYDHDKTYPGGVWCFAGGKSERTKTPGETSTRNETPEETARREAREETGLTLGKLELIGTRPSTSPSGQRFEIWCYVCSDWSGEMKSFPSEEHEAARLVNRTELDGFDLAGPVTEWLAEQLVARGTAAPRGLGT